MRAVLADTGPLYALVDSKDGMHARARSEVQILNDERYSVLLIYPILLEAYTMILHRLGTKAAHRWSREVTNSVQLVNVSDEQYQRAVIKTRRFSDQSITLFDAVVACIAEDMDLPVWTYDQDFDVMKISVWR